MNIKSSIHILFELATKIKWISDTSLTAEMNSEYLSNVRYYDEFYNKYTYPICISAICQYLEIIYCCSFMDEYENWFTPGKFPDETNRILKVKNVVKPAYKRIKKWNDIKKLRNNILAHNHRIDGESIFEIENKIKYNVPSSNAEYVLLSDLIFIIAKNIYPVFPEIVTESNFKLTLRDQLKFQSEKIDAYSEYKKIEKEIENNLKSMIGEKQL